MKGLCFNSSLKIIWNYMEYGKSVSWSVVAGALLRIIIQRRTVRFHKQF
jgi:hypothetical protein